MTLLRLATLWFDGCSGCHMSLLDTDERLLELASKMEIVYSPLVDAKEFPVQVDCTCIEGAISSPADETKLRLVRQRSRLLVAMGDCAVTGNVPSMRNVLGADTILHELYSQRPLLNPQVPAMDLPPLHAKALPLHHFVPVDLFLPGCPPAADILFAALIALIEGRMPEPLATRFGA